jgi:hypothetical protein
MDHFTISGNLIYDLSDHLPNFLIMTKFSALPSLTKFYKRDYPTLDECALYYVTSRLSFGDEMLELNQNPVKLNKELAEVYKWLCVNIPQY